MGAMPPVMDDAHVTRRGDGVEVGGGGGLLEPPAEFLLPPSELVAPPLEVVPEVVVLLGLVTLLEDVLKLVWEL
jgi:hypothetical protein